MYNALSKLLASLGTSDIPKTFKRNPPGVQAVSQLEAYILDFREKNPGVVVRGILCAPRVPMMVRTLLADKGFEWREFRPSFELGDEKQRRLDEFI